MNSIGAGDQASAESRLRRLGVPFDRPIGRLSGGQAAQVALAVALAKRADLLVLDEPVANLDPLARREFLRELVEATASDGTTAILSSHLIADLERACDYIVILASGRMQVVGEIDKLLRSHKLLVGPHLDSGFVESDFSVIETRHTTLETSFLVNTHGHSLPPHWRVLDVSLEDLVLAYLANPRSATLPDHTGSDTKA